MKSTNATKPGPLLPEEIRVRLGHEHPETTNGYYHWDQSEVRARLREAIASATAAARREPKKDAE